MPKKGEVINLTNFPISSSLAKAHLEEYMDKYDICPRCTGEGEINKLSEEPPVKDCQVRFKNIESIVKFYKKTVRNSHGSFSNIVKRAILRNAKALVRCKKCEGTGFVKKE